MGTRQPQPSERAGSGHPEQRRVLPATQEQGLWPSYSGLALPTTSSAGNKCTNTTQGPSQPRHSPPVMYELHPRGRKRARKITCPQPWFLPRQLTDGRSTDFQNGQKGEILQTTELTPTLQQMLQLITVTKHTLWKRSDQFRSKHGLHYTEVTSDYLSLKGIRQMPKLWKRSVQVSDGQCELDGETPAE